MLLKSVLLLGFLRDPVVVVNDTQLSVVSETEVRHSRLLIHITDSQEESTAAEFMCIRGGVKTMEIRSSHSDGDQFDEEQVEKAGQRRWVVKKVYLNRMKEICVDRWSVNSYVNYVCSAGEEWPWLHCAHIHTECKGMLLYAPMHIHVLCLTHVCIT